MPLRTVPQGGDGERRQQMDSGCRGPERLRMLDCIAHFASAHIMTHTHYDRRSCSLSWCGCVRVCDRVRDRVRDSVRVRDCVRDRVGIFLGGFFCKVVC